MSARGGVDRTRLVAPATSSAAPTGWQSAATWTGDGIRREVFYFSSGSDILYASSYAGVDRRRPTGLVVCSSWGIEADRSQGLAHRLALAMAELGGVGVTFHYRGYGDSSGDASSVTWEALAASVVDATEEAARRHPGCDWMLVGLMLGSSAAVLAGEPARASQLLLVQPALDPPAYFHDLGQHGKRSGLRTSGEEDIVFGHPVPASLRAEPAARSIKAAVASVAQRCALIRYASSPGDPGLTQAADVTTVPGTWRFGARAYPELLHASLDWLAGTTGHRLLEPSAPETASARKGAGTTAMRIRDFVNAGLQEEVQSEDPLAAGLLDSLGAEQLIAYLQDELDIEFAAGELGAESFASISTLAQVVDAKCRAATEENDVR